MAYLPVSEEPLAYILGPDSLLFDFRGCYTLIDNGASSVSLTKHVRQANCVLNSAPTASFAANVSSQLESKPVPVVGNLIDNELKKKLKEHGVPHVLVKQTADYEPFVLYKHLAEGRLELVVLDGGLKPTLDLVKKAVDKGDVAGLDSLAQKTGMIFALVWHPANEEQKIRRILYTGSASADRIISALEKSAPLAIFQIPTVTTAQAAGGVQVPARVVPRPARASLPAASTSTRPAAAPRAPAAKPTAPAARPTATTRTSTVGVSRPAPTAARAPVTKTTTTTTTATRTAFARPAPTKPAAPAASARTTAAARKVEPLKKTAAPAKPVRTAAPAAKPAEHKKAAPKAEEKKTIVKEEALSFVYTPVLAAAVAAPVAAAAIAAATIAAASEEHHEEPKVETPAPEHPEEPKAEVAAPEPPKEEEKVPEKEPEIPVITLADTPAVDRPDVLESTADQPQPEPHSPHHLPEVSCSSLAPEVNVIPATPEPPHDEHEDEQPREEAHAADKVTDEKPNAPAPEVDSHTDEKPHIDEPQPEEKKDEVVVEPAPGFDEPIAPQPVDENGLLDNIDPPMQLRKINMDTDKEALIDFSSQPEHPADPPKTIDFSSEHVVDTTRSPEIPPNPDRQLHDAVMTAISSVLVDTSSLDISGLTNNFANVNLNGGHHVPEHVPESNGHGEDANSNKMKAMETRSSVVELGDENRRFEETDPALDDVLVTVAAQSEQEDRRRSQEDEDSGWKPLHAGEPGAPLHMTLIRKDAAAKPRLSRERYFELVTVPHVGNKCTLQSAEEAKNFFAAVRSPIYVLASEDLPPYVLDGWLEGKKTWLKPDSPSALYPSTNTPALHAFATMHREALEGEHMHIHSAIDSTTLIVHVDNGQEQFHAAKALF